MKQLVAMIPETDEEKRNHDPYHNFRTMDGKLTEAGEVLVGLAIGLLSNVCFVNSKAHGWYEPYMVDKGCPDPQCGDSTWDHDCQLGSYELGQRNFGEVMMLIASEVSEAFEAFRDGDDQNKISYKHTVDYETQILTDTPVFQDGNMTEPSLGKPEGITAELADVLIRVFDYAGAYGIPLAEAVIRKHFYNFTRPYRHGGKLA